MICLFAFAFWKDTAALERRPLSKSDSRARFTAKPPPFEAIVARPRPLFEAFSHQQKWALTDSIMVFEGRRRSAVTPAQLTD